MLPFLASLLLAADPSLADLQRFPTLDQTQAPTKGTDVPRSLADSPW
jgi:hypothetical protein